VPPNLDRHANRAAPAGDLPVGDPEGFTFVEIVIAALLAGIFAAIIVFSVFTVTHPAPKPDPACTSEVKDVQDAIAKYFLKHKFSYPLKLEDLVKAKLLDTAPSKTSPSGVAGFTYNSDTGEYTGQCPKR
jgi:competence protein ComGC